jgi:hypothetical protein
MLDDEQIVNLTDCNDDVDMVYKNKLPLLKLHFDYSNEIDQIAVLPVSFVWPHNEKTLPATVPRSKLRK